MFILQKVKQGKVKSVKLWTKILIALDILIILGVIAGEKFFSI